MDVREFKELIEDRGRELFRRMPWREDTQPYYVLVSELMLQQTQVARVIPKFQAFVTRFPDIRSLANADLSDVLVLWQGLGYNRRAKFLHDAAKRIAIKFDGVFPETSEDILSLPGVGKNTLGAIEAYAMNRPAIFVETNVRTVYIHHFFDDDVDVEDSQIREMLTRTLDVEHPREFYWAIMDYGSWLKANGVRNIGQSKHYKKQAVLEGSVRQMRGRIIRALTRGATTETDLSMIVDADERFAAALSGLMNDGLVARSGSMIHLTK